MATNLRLSAAAEEAVRLEAGRSGRSQQDVIRDAIAQQLGVVDDASNTVGVRRNLAALIATGIVRPPRTSAIYSGARIVLPPELSTADLLDRDDRL